MAGERRGKDDRKQNTYIPVPRKKGENCGQVAKNYVSCTIIAECSAFNIKTSTMWIISKGILYSASKVKKECQSRQFSRSLIMKM